MTFPLAGKRGLEKENGVKPSKKQKVAEKVKETEEEIEMVEAEEVIVGGLLPSASRWYFSKLTMRVISC